MNTYVSQIIIISIVGGIVTSLLSRKSSHINKYINFIIGLICTIVLISPIVTFTKNTTIITQQIEEIFSSDKVSISNEIIINTSVEKLNKGIEENLMKKFNLNDDDINVITRINKDNIENIMIEEIEITLCNKAIWLDDSKIIEYAKEITGSKIKINRN